MSPDPHPRLRASDADREATVTRLNVAANEGRLDAEELDRRLGAAYAATLCSELDVLTEDVTVAAAPTPAPTPTRVTHPPRRTNGMAIASIVAGVAWIAWLGSVVAIVCGHIALRQIKDSEGAEGGQGLAVAGLVLGYGGLAFFVLSVAMIAGW